MTTTAVTGSPAPPGLWTLPGVYAPQADTRLLARALRAEEVGAGTEVLDIGTGSGALAVLAARMGARVAATDISWRAVLTARINALRSRQRVSVRHGDLSAPWRGRLFDLLLSNPPYVPAPHGHAAARGAARAWDAGRDGRRTVDRLSAHAPPLLRPGGVLLLVHSGLCGVGTTLRQLDGAGLRCSVAERTRVPFGPLLTERLAWLRAEGIVGAHEDEEELVAIRAARP